MPTRANIGTAHRGQPRDIGDLAAAAHERRRADWNLSMSERLARVHVLCKQMSEIKGAARAH